MKKINLGGSVSTVAASAKPSHPTVEADAEMQALLEQFAQVNPQYKTLEKQSKALSSQLSPRIKALYFGRFAGITPETSTMLVVAGGKTIKLICKDAYSTMVQDEAGIVAAIGQELFEKHFRQSTVLKLDLDNAPEDKREEFANRVIALAEEMALVDVVSGKQCFQPVAGFHEARTTLLTPEQNVRLDKALPITAYPQI